MFQTTNKLCCIALHFIHQNRIIDIEKSRRLKRRWSWRPWQKKSLVMSLENRWEGTSWCDFMGYNYDITNYLIMIDNDWWWLWWMMMMYNVSILSRLMTYFITTPSAKHKSIYIYIHTYIYMGMRMDRSKRYHHLQLENHPPPEQTWNSKLTRVPK